MVGDVIVHPISEDGPFALPEDDIPFHVDLQRDVLRLVCAPLKSGSSPRVQMTMRSVEISIGPIATGPRDVLDRLPVDQELDSAIDGADVLARLVVKSPLDVAEHIASLVGFEQARAGRGGRAGRIGRSYRWRRRHRSAPATGTGPAHGSIDPAFSFGHGSLVDAGNRLPRCADLPNVNLHRGPRIEPAEPAFVRQPSMPAGTADVENHLSFHIGDHFAPPLIRRGRTVDPEHGFPAVDRTLVLRDAAIPLKQPNFIRSLVPAASTVCCDDDRPP